VIVFLAKAFKKFPSRNIYIVTAVFYSVFLIYEIAGEFLINCSIISFPSTDILIKLGSFLFYAFLSPYLLVFISIEKFITIRLPHNNLVKNHKFQTLIVFVLIACNLIAVHPIFYLDLYKIQMNNTSNQTKLEYSKEYFDFLIFFLIYFTVLPFIIMMIFSFLLIETILKSRLRILRLTNQHDRNRLKKDIQFAISSIFLNIFYLLLNLPYFVYILLSSDLYSDLLSNVLTTLFLIQFCDQFYILFCFNSVFRRNVLIMFRFKLQLYQANTQNLSTSLSIR